MVVFNSRHLNHFKALLDLIKMHQLEQKTHLHAFIDGRDTEILIQAKVIFDKFLIMVFN